MKNRSDVCRIALSASQMATSTGISAVKTIAIASRRRIRPITAMVTSLLTGRSLLDQLVQEPERVEPQDRFEVQCRRFGRLHSVDQVRERALGGQPIDGPCPFRERTDAFERRQSNIDALRNGERRNDWRKNYLAHRDGF